MKNRLPVVFCAGLAAALAATAPHAWAGEDEEGVPHILVGANAGAVELEFEVVTPTPGVFGPGGEDLLTLFVPQAQGPLATPLPGLGGTVFASNPLSGNTSGVINDDTGFEAEGLPAGADINVQLTSIDLAPGVDFAFLFGSTVLSSGTLNLAGSGLTQVDSSTVVGLPGDDEFDFHPTFLLVSTLTDPAAIEGTFVFEVSDTGSAGLAPASFALRLTADPAAAVLVPEPATAGLLAFGGLAMLRRRR